MINLQARGTTGAPKIRLMDTSFIIPAERFNRFSPDGTYMGNFGNQIAMNEAHIAARKQYDEMRKASRLYVCDRLCNHLLPSPDANNTSKKYL